MTLLVWLILLWRPRPGSFLSPIQRLRAVPWTGSEIVVLFLLAHAVIPMLVLTLLEQLRFFSWLYGEEFVVNLSAATPNNPARQRTALWAQALTTPILVSLCLWITRRLSGTRAYQLGLGSDHLRRNLLLGALTASCVNPFVHLVYRAVEQIQKWYGVSLENHPIGELADKIPLEWFDWGALLFATLIAAPVVEEILFRGLLQAWVIVRPQRGSYVVVAALLLTLYLRGPHLAAAFAKGEGSWLPEVLPLVFVSVMGLGYFLLCRFTASQAARGIFASSLFFGMAHSFVWPSPVPLFVLGLGLGFITYRTQNLFPAIVAHCLFNVIGCLELLLK